MIKEEMIRSVFDILRNMYYEDIEFFYGFLKQYAEKKGIKVSSSENTLRDQNIAIIQFYLPTLSDKHLGLVKGFIHGIVEGERRT